MTMQVLYLCSMLKGYKGCKVQYSKETASSMFNAQVKSNYDIKWDVGSTKPIILVRCKLKKC